MSGVVRLTLVSHGMTDAMSAGRFPIDEPLNDAGRRQFAATMESGDGRVVCGPELRAQQSAELLGLTPAVDTRLADLDCGRWRGEALDQVAPDELALWLTEPASAPHGGETVVDVIARVRDWLASMAAERIRTVAVTHPAVVRAAVVVALDAPPKSFWRIDVEPASRTVLHYRGQAWTLRLNR
ncbi:histidine phosphatase family protein [Mycolicibacterium duvalii]|uniref:Phosphoglycerate mutase n=1 Tax=Mycolicibacterium duvalii TaxID=39688 RepID=A0A7I7K950_9MYCO|nr:histidine phosphatase family protein [Mycolicibacterium duvalii]MCV7371065.1 histidine phosphatase family protein [Mycolicibacterium duvalii]PEG37147.1 histidine phosphatase family protein [Mycolicibacterium duvalii]BBX20008.1 phosphoglycerate mutase [Mycolicibacterium duvalii]